MAFRYKNLRVIVYPREITIKDLETEAEAREVLDYLKGVLEKEGNK